MNDNPRYHNGLGQPISSDPSWGNSTNVGFAPGSVGGVPAQITKWTFQKRLYMQLYGNDIVAGFMVAPIFITLLLTPMLLVAAVFSIFLAYLGSAIAFATAGQHGDFGILVAIVFSAGAWIIGIGFALYFTVGMWIAALVHHRRRGGMFSKHLEWTKTFG